MPEVTLTTAIVAFLVAATILFSPLAVLIKVNSDRDKMVTEQAAKYEIVLERLHTVELASVVREGEYAKQLGMVNLQLTTALDRLESVNKQLMAANTQLDAANIQIVSLQLEVKGLREQIAVLVQAKTTAKEG